MGWACMRCGDVNPGLVEKCEECGTGKGTASRLRIDPQPLSTNLIWLATLLGGTLAGYSIAIWNGRLLKKHGLVTTIAYGVLAIGGWVLAVIIIANLTPPQDQQGLVEPGFGIPVALALSFLLVSIAYNRDTLAANQWIWSHPGRKLVLNFGGTAKDDPKGSTWLRKFKPSLAYTSFAGAQGDLFGTSLETSATFSIPLVPLAVVVFSAIIGYLTLILANSLAPR